MLLLTTWRLASKNRLREKRSFITRYCPLWSLSCHTDQTQATGRLALPRSWDVRFAFCTHGAVIGFAGDDDGWHDADFGYDSATATFCVLVDGQVIHRTPRDQGPPIVLAPSEDPRNVRLILVPRGAHALNEFWDINLVSIHHRQALLANLLNMGSTIMQRSER